MFTNLGADPRLVEEARRLGKHATKTAAIKAALQEYVQWHKAARAHASRSAGRRKKR